MRAASEGRDTHMLKQPGHFTSMKKEFGDCTRRFSLWRFSSSSRGGCSRSISPIEMPACESRERARGLSAKSERYERRPQAGQRSANAEESPAAVAAVAAAPLSGGAGANLPPFRFRRRWRRQTMVPLPAACRPPTGRARRASQCNAHHGCSSGKLCERRAGRPRGEKWKKVGTGNSHRHGFRGCGLRGTRRAGTWDVDHPDHLVLLRRVAASSCSAVSGSSFPW